MKMNGGNAKWRSAKMNWEISWEEVPRLSKMMVKPKDEMVIMKCSIRAGDTQVDGFSQKVSRASIILDPVKTAFRARMESFQEAAANFFTATMKRFIPEMGMDLSDAPAEKPGIVTKLEPVPGQEGVLTIDPKNPPKKGDTITVNKIKFVVDAGFAALPPQRQAAILRKFFPGVEIIVESKSPDSKADQN